MTRFQKTMGMLAACALIGVSPVRAERFRSPRDCSATAFATCSAVHLSVQKDGLSIGERNASWREALGADQGRTFRLIPRGDDAAPGGEGFDGPASTTCPVPSRNPLDCPSVVTVTPEPVTMSLLATGLVGMSGMGFLRRRRKSQPG